MRFLVELAFMLKLRFLTNVHSEFCRKMSGRLSRTIYVGNLPGDIREREVEDLFYKVIYSINYLHSFLVWYTSKL